MKKIILLFVASLIILSGCSDKKQEVISVNIMGAEPYNSGETNTEICGLCNEKGNCLDNVKVKYNLEIANYNGKSASCEITVNGELQGTGVASYSGLNVFRAVRKDIRNDLILQICCKSEIGSIKCDDYIHKRICSYAYEED